ncbi:molybdopterin-binding domain-containing protein [Candidatus Nitrosoglobus terrae]|uniref:Molybdopterin-binding domain-containing protein n=1 Tax=Candidatus Nitrosoglobus terrae TaxID=1630141 RepID=A0A1Q2SMW8_9GAMM|nr:molybdopterin-binding protein [Candidatus Nitrosoglobus terrae]BAW80495.1 molybdopterin-binding domain-containing protein [Candidatus Nitrosoglobus terrae]
MNTPQLGSIIIGDELLNGKRHDKHFSHLIEALAKRGLELAWCNIIGDNTSIITKTLRYSLNSIDIVFCFGGIGATPDDRTRHCAAEAIGVSLYPHPEAIAEIKAQYGERAYPYRIRMADLPQGSRIIPNPLNRVPGFSLKSHYFLPGFPEMAWPMMEWVLDTYYPNLQNLAPEAEQQLQVLGVGESDLLPTLEDFVSRYPRIRLSCLPQISTSKPALELGLRGNAQEVNQAMDELKHNLDNINIRWYSL